MSPKKQKAIELPRGASISQDGMITLPEFDTCSGVDTENKSHYLLSMSVHVSEWSHFFDVIDDINIAMQANIVENVIQCPTCNTITTHVEYEEPNDEEMH